MGEIWAARARTLTVDGHVPRVGGSDLHEAAQYLDTDHECTTESEVWEKVDLGFRVYLREGACSKNLTHLVGIVDDVPMTRLSLCSDDRDIVDPVENGGVDFLMRKAIDSERSSVEPKRSASTVTD